MLSTTKTQILFYLDRSKDEKLEAKYIAAELGKTYAYIYLELAVMVEMGYITKEVVDNNSRWHPTEKGMEVARKAQKDHKKYI